MMRIVSRVFKSWRCIAVFAALGQPLVSGAAPTSVVITGNLQSEVGCSSDFNPSCAQSALAYDAIDDVWQSALNIPAGAFSYFAALNGSFVQTYGVNGGTSLNPIPLSLANGRLVKFYYDDKSHWVTDNVRTPIVTLAGDFQSELGCSGDFDPGCLRSWLQDIDGDGIYTLTTDVLPAGDYSTVVAIDESFDEVYGLGGVPRGANIDFTVAGGSTSFCYDSRTHLLGVNAACSADGSTVPEPSSVSLLLAAAFAGVLGRYVGRRRSN